jgi:hypothetical protein
MQQLKLLKLPAKLELATVRQQLLEQLPQLMIHGQQPLLAAAGLRHQVMMHHPFNQN